MPTAELKTSPKRPRENEWQITLVDLLNRGVVLNKRADSLDDDQLLVGLNVENRQDRLVISSGFGGFGQAVRGMPQADYQLFKRDGSSYLVLITTATFYAWSKTALEWQYVSDGVGTTVAVAGVATDLDIEVADDTGFGDGDFIGIMLDDGTQHQTTVNGAPAANVITFDDALPSGVAIGKAVVKAVDLSGNDTDLVSITTVPSDDIMVFVNGVDPPKKFNGSTCETLAGLPAGFNTAHLVIQWGVYLLLLNTVESGVALPQRVRRSDIGNPENWTTGDAGFDDLYETEDQIRAVDLLGSNIVIYKERSIIVGVRFGTVDRLFDFVTVINGEGCHSADSVVDLGDRHIFWGNANIYEFNGTQNLQPIADNVFTKLFGSTSEVDPARGDAIFGFYVEELDEVWFFYPAIGDDWPSQMVRYQLETDSFLFRTFNMQLSGFGFYQLDADKAWNDLVGSWLDQTWNWNDRTQLSGAPTIHLMCDTHRQVHEWSFSSAGDEGTDISYEVRSKEWFVPARRIRVDFVQAVVTGSNVTIAYSDDRGASWKTLKTVSPGATYETVRVRKQFTTNSLIFRFTGTGGGFGIESFGFRWRLDSVNLG